MKQSYETLEHIADVGIIAYGSDVITAFTNVALAMFSLITYLDNVNIFLRNVEISAIDEGELLIAWLNELIYLFDTGGVLFREFDVLSISGRTLE
ncbi:archease [Chloroflexota bacterium]